MRTFDPNDESFENLPLRRDPDGTFVQDNIGHDVGCDDLDDRCAEDEDPNSEGHLLPGTADDRPYSLAEDGAEPADLLGQAERGLVQEDELEGVRLDEAQVADAERILDAMGADSGEPLPHAPGGVSATGDDGVDEHGGFPRRD